MEFELRPHPEMLIDTVDLLNRPVGTIPRQDVLSAGANFRVAHLFLFNEAGELLLQQLSRFRERHPLAWGSSVAAYMFAGETYEDAIRRRVRQELGRRLDDITCFGQTAMADRDSEKFIGLFVSRAAGPFVVDSDHIERVEFLAMSEIARLMANGERTFTPTFRHLFSFYAGETQPVG